MSFTNDMAAETQKVGLHVLGELVQAQATLLIKQAVADERQMIVDAIYSRFIGGASGDGTAIDIVDIIRKRSEA